MKLGVNWTDAESGRIISKFIAEGQIEFCEILIDNFLHFEPEQLLEVTGNVPIAFHIMRTRFLEVSANELLDLLRRIKRFEKVLRPIYVSDHIAKFRQRGQVLARPLEWGYPDFETVREAVDRYQQCMGRQLLVENFPSAGSGGIGQCRFYQRLFDATGAGLLFDVSNAIVAERNGGELYAEWQPLLKNCQHFHAGGFRPADIDDNHWLDSHDAELAGETLEGLAGLNIGTLVVERDSEREYSLWSQDLHSARGQQ